MSGSEREVTSQPAPARLTVRGILGVYRPVLLPQFWYYLVFGVPYVIYGVFAGFASSFETGDASLFIVVVLISAMGESALVVVSGERRTEPVPRLWFLLLVLALLGSLAWNLYFVAVSRGSHSSTVDWVQLLAFAVTLNVATWVRFAFVKDSSIFDIRKNYRNVRAYFETVLADRAGE